MSPTSPGSCPPFVSFSPSFHPLSDSAGWGGTGPCREAACSVRTKDAWQGQATHQVQLTPLKAALFVKGLRGQEAINRVRRPRCRVDYTADGFSRPLCTLHQLPGALWNKGLARQGCSWFHRDHVFLGHVSEGLGALRALKPLGKVPLLPPVPTARVLPPLTTTHTHASSLRTSPGSELPG